MPELPDLQVFSENLQKLLKGKKVDEISLHKSGNVNISQVDLRKKLKGAAIKKVKREGKELHLLFDNQHTLALHLMLNGRLAFFEKGDDPKYVILKLRFTDHTNLTLSDFRSMAKVTLDPKESNVV